MHITRLADAKRYDAPKHFDMCGLRLQGLQATPAGFAWVGLSHFLPGGGAEMDAGATEKIYVVLSGEVTITLADGSRTHLHALDSCLIDAGESRAITNERNDVATMLVVMPGPRA
jgi:mannose-6-phosphate isomerase-like protein (cupin superfamily)